MQYEVSTTIYMDKKANHQIFDVHIQRAHVHFYTNFSMFLCLSLWLGELSADNTDNNDDAGHTVDKAWLINSNSKDAAAEQQYVIKCA